MQEVAVTELEVKLISGQTVQQQIKDYQTVAAACKKVKKCVGITVWGVIDKVRLICCAENGNDANYDGP